MYYYYFIKIVLFIFRMTRISKFFSRFRLVAVSILHREKIHSTYASDAGADKSNASGTRLWYTAWQSIQNCLSLVPPWLQLHHVSVQLLLRQWTLCVANMGVSHLSSLRNVLSRNVNFCSTCALTEEVLAVVKSELSVAGWVSFAACWITHSLAAWRRPANSGDSRHAPTVGSIRQAATGTGLKLVMSGCSIHPNHFDLALNFRCSFYSVQLQSF